MVPPVTTPGGKPVTALPDETPRFPLMPVAPVLVTVEQARTAKLEAVPSVGAVARRGLACPIRGSARPMRTAHAASPIVTTRLVLFSRLNMERSDQRVE